MRLAAILVGAVVVALGMNAANAQPPPPTIAKPMSKEDIEQLEQIEKAMGSLNELQVSLDAMLRGRKYKCLKAFGSEPFCSCLNEKLAVGLGFDGYIFVITKTKDELLYAQMSKDDKALVDSAVRTRDLCVK